MKLSQIVEARHDELLSFYGPEQLQQYRNELSRSMPSRKEKHSLRVGNTVARFMLHKEVIDAALFHDYVERGGDIQYAATALGFSPHTVKLINLLSMDNKDQGGSVLGHMREVLSDPALSEDTRNHLIIIKLADRLDKLKRLDREGKPVEEYLKKSEDLARFLLSRYSGDPEYVKLLMQRMQKYGLGIQDQDLGSDLGAQSEPDSGDVEVQELLGPWPHQASTDQV